MIFFFSALQDIFSSARGVKCLDKYVLLWVLNTLIFFSFFSLQLQKKHQMKEQAKKKCGRGLHKADVLSSEDEKCIAVEGLVKLYRLLLLLLVGSFVSRLSPTLRPSSLRISHCGGSRRPCAVFGPAPPRERPACSPWPGPGST